MSYFGPSGFLDTSMNLSQYAVISYIGLSTLAVIINSYAWIYEKKNRSYFVKPKISSKEYIISIVAGITLFFIGFILLKYNSSRLIGYGFLYAGILAFIYTIAMWLSLYSSKIRTIVSIVLLIGFSIYAYALSKSLIK
jgi:hypothetical protein